MVKPTVVEVEFECNISAYAIQPTWMVKSTTTHDPNQSRDPDGCWGEVFWPTWIYSRWKEFWVTKRSGSVNFMLDIYSQPRSTNRKTS